MFINTSAISLWPRNQPQTRVLLVSLLAACAIIGYTLLWEDGINIVAEEKTTESQLSQRELAFLTNNPSSETSQFETLHKPPATDDNKSSPCSKLFVYLPHTFSGYGHGSQLNGYLLATMIATYEDRAMLLIEDENSGGWSQFGCPAESSPETMVVQDEQHQDDQELTSNINQTQLLSTSSSSSDIPNGFQRLVKHPDWLSRQCSLPCQPTSWKALRKLGKEGRQLNCGKSTSPNTSTRVMDGFAARDYFDNHVKGKMIDRSSNEAREAAYMWAIRLGASHTEAHTFAYVLNKDDDDDEQMIWDFVRAFLARSPGMLTFQPYIARDVESFIRSSDLPLNVNYDAIHVRRGDKLISDAKPWVLAYWKSRADEGGEEEPKNYMPFEHYLSKYEIDVGGSMEDDMCNAKDDQAPPRLIYIATDDQDTVQSEISQLPTSTYNGVPYPTTPNGCIKLKVIFSPRHDKNVHIHLSKGSDDCVHAYKRNIASIADLMILIKSDLFIGEYNSNWGRLVRVFRMDLVKNGMDASTKEEPGGEGGGVVARVRDMKIAWGDEVPSPPGW